MKIIVFSTLAGILLLQGFGLIPMSSIEGPLAIAFVIFAGVIAVGLHEAWTEKRRRARLAAEHRHCAGQRVLRRAGPAAC